MAFSDLGSAIDDSFDPTIFPSAPGPVGGDDDRSYYNGPRSGHWTVTSSIGSAIDDRCPTIWGSNAGPNKAGQPGGHVKPIAGSLLRKLAKASLQERAAEAEVEDEKERHTDIDQKLRQHNEHKRENERTKLKQDAKPKGFYIPRANDIRGIKITTKDSKEEVIRAPRVLPESEKNFRKSYAELRRARAPSPQPTVASERAPSTIPQACLPKPRVIRIRGEDGQEAFVDLPNLPRPISRPPTAAVEKYTLNEKEALKKLTKEANIEKTKQERYEKQRDAASKMAAKAMMSGALPPAQDKQRTQQKAKHDLPSRQSPPQGPQAQQRSMSSTKSSAKDSAVGLGGLFETAATVTSAHSSKAMSVKSLQAAVQSISKNSKSSKTPSQIEAKSRTPDHSFYGMVGSQEFKPPSTYVASIANQERPSSGQHPSNGSRVFAGRGWISPHPLSRSSSAVRTPPQSHISLPRDDFVDGAKMTYNDWKAMQEAETAQRRNFSRTTSVVSDRVKAVAESLAWGSGLQASGQKSVAGSHAYHKATVESEYGSQPETLMLASRQGSQRTASLRANGWGAMPQYDGSSEEDFAPSKHTSAEYERQLQEIIAQYPPQMAYYEQAGGETASPQHEIQLDMPWDREHGSSSSVHTSSSTYPQQYDMDYTPPSAANYSPPYGMDASETRQRVYPRKGRSPPMPAPMPVRFYDASGVEQAVDDYEEASLVPSAYRSMTSDGFEEIERAERGYGGY